MKMVKRRKKLLEGAFFLLIISFAASSLGENGDEDLFKRANQIFSPLPQVMTSEKNSVTPRKSQIRENTFL